MSAQARTWSSPTAAKPVGRPATSEPRVPIQRYKPIVKHSLVIRFRAERAHQMARAQRMGLPDILRMMLTEAVGNEDFSIDLADDQRPEGEREHVIPRMNVFEPRYWDPLKQTLDAELAMALLHRAAAEASARWDEARNGQAEVVQEKLHQERQEALRLLADHDVSSTMAIDDILKRLGRTESTAPNPIARNSTRPSKRRTLAEQDRFLTECLIPDLTAYASPSKNPAAMVVMGQPGAGVSVAAAVLAREMCRTTGPAVALSTARIRAYDAGFDPARAQRWLDRAVDAARQRRLHLVLEDELQDPLRLRRLTARLRRDGYVVQVVALCVSPQTSRLALAARYALWRQHGVAPEFVTAAEHDQALADLRAALHDFEEHGNVDGLRVIARDGRQLFENRMAGDDWLRPPKACAVLDKEQSRAFPDKEAVQLAMRWESCVAPGCRARSCRTPRCRATWQATSSMGETTRSSDAEHASPAHGCFNGRMKARPFGRWIGSPSRPRSRTTREPPRS